MAGTNNLKISYYRYKVVSGHVMATYFKWHMCPCHEPLVTQISNISVTFNNFIYELSDSKNGQISKGVILVDNLCHYTNGMKMNLCSEYMF